MHTLSQDLQGMVLARKKKRRGEPLQNLRCADATETNRKQWREHDAKNVTREEPGSSAPGCRELRTAVPETLSP